MTGRAMTQGGRYGVSAGFRNRNSRTFVFSRNDSETFSPLEHPDDVAVLKRRLLFAAGRVRSLLHRVFAHDDVFRETRVWGADRREESQQRAIGAEQLGQRDGERLRRPQVEKVEEIPAQNAVDATRPDVSSGSAGIPRRVFPSSSDSDRDRRTRSSRMILQPSRSPKNVTFEPTTGPRSIRTGDSRDVRVARNFRSALVGNVWPASASAAAGAAASFRSLLRESQSN